ELILAGAATLVPRSCQHISRALTLCVRMCSKLAVARAPGHVWPMATVEITAGNFQETIEKQGIVLLDFWAEWCAPCRVFAPVYEKASEKHKDVTFGKIDTEAQQDLAGAANIQAIPTLMVFRDGVLLFRE